LLVARLFALPPALPTLPRARVVLARARSRRRVLGRGTTFAASAPRIA
jgi:hypothetical protein